MLWFLRSDLAEEVQGDLEEKYYATLKRKSMAGEAKLLVSGPELYAAIRHPEEQAILS